MSNIFFFEPHSYVYLNHLIFNDSFLFSLYLNKTLYFFNYILLNFIFSFDVIFCYLLLLFILLYLITLLNLFFIISLNLVINLNFFNNILAYFSFFLIIFFSFILNFFTLTTIYLSHYNINYKFRFFFTEDLKLNFNDLYSNIIIWKIWIYFLNLVHIYNLYIYINFSMYFFFRYFLKLCFFYLFNLILLLKYIVIKYYSKYSYYYNFLFQVYIYILFFILTFFRIAHFWKFIWLDFYNSFLINKILSFFYSVSFYFFNPLNFTFKHYYQNINNNIFTIFFKFTYLVLFNIFSNIFLRFGLSKIFLYFFKILLYFFSFLLNFNFRYFIIFYVHFLYSFFFGFFIYIYRHIFNFYIYLYKFLLYLVTPFFYFFINSLIFFIKKLFIIFYWLLPLIFLFFLDLYYIHLIVDFILDYFSYLYGFFLFIFKPLVDFSLQLFYLDTYVYKSFFTITFFHQNINFTKNYNFFIDFIYFLKSIFIFYFPYKIYLFFSIFFNFKNLFFSILFFNQFFLIFWYLFLNYFFNFSVFTEFFSFILHNINYLLSWILLNFYISVDIFWIWFFLISFNSFYFLSFLDYFFFIDYFFFKLVLIDFLLNFSYIFHYYFFINYNLADYLVFNLIIYWFFIIYDYFFYYTYQYPFDGLLEDYNYFTDGKIYLKSKLRSRIYKYYYYYYYYYYRLSFGNNYFYSIDDSIFFNTPFTKYRHKNKLIRTRTYYQILNLKYLVPSIYSKWKSLLWLKLKYKVLWGPKFKLFQFNHAWLPENYRLNTRFVTSTLNPLAMTYYYSFFPLDQKKGFGFSNVDSFFNFNIMFIIIFIFIFFSWMSTSFRKFFFPKTWFVNNSEYLWDMFRLDKTNSLLWLYVDRSSMLPAGATKKEVELGTRFTYKELSERIPLETTDFSPFYKSAMFSSYYKNRYSGDFDKLMLFDYFSLSSFGNNKYILPAYLRESYYHFTDLGEEEPDYLNIPSTMDFDKKLIFLKNLNKFFFNIDRLFKFRLPDWVFHKELANNYYYQFPDETYFIPYDFSNQYENLNSWVIIFPLIIYHYGSFEFIFSMDSLVFADIFQYSVGFLNLNYFFDGLFNFIYFDYIVIDQDTINSSWTYIRGIYDNRFFFVKGPIFFDYYEILYYKKFIFFDYLDSFFKFSLWLNLSFKSIILNFFILFFYLILIIFFMLKLIKFFKFQNKNVNYINKFIFYFLKKYNYKLKIYGINNKT